MRARAGSRLAAFAKRFTRPPMLGVDRKHMPTSGVPRNIHNTAVLEYEKKLPEFHRVAKRKLITSLF
jgi:hypothetical protein